MVYVSSICMTNRGYLAEIPLRAFSIDEHYVYLGEATSSCRKNSVSFRFFSSLFDELSILKKSILQL